MTKNQRTNKIILLDIEQKVIEHEVILSDLKNHFENHLSHHEAKSRDERKHRRALIIVTIGSLLTAAGTLIVGFILLSYGVS